MDHIIYKREVDADETLEGMSVNTRRSILVTYSTTVKFLLFIIFTRFSSVEFALSFSDLNFFYKCKFNYSIPALFDNFSDFDMSNINSPSQMSKKSKLGNPEVIYPEVMIFVDDVLFS